MPTNAVEVIEVAPVTTPASTLIVPSRRIADPPAGVRFSAAAEVIVKAPELVDQVDAPDAVIVMGFLQELPRWFHRG